MTTKEIVLEIINIMYPQCNLESIAIQKIGDNMELIFYGGAQDINCLCLRDFCQEHNHVFQIITYPTYFKLILPIC